MTQMLDIAKKLMQKWRSGDMNDDPHGSPANFQRSFINPLSNCWNPASFQ